MNLHNKEDANLIIYSFIWYNY